MILNIKNKIRMLAKEKNAIILAHNYQPPEIQDIADLCGDSLELSIRASKTNAKIIVFCGVHFMAETASILCPDKKVLLPRLDAGCPMANMVTADALKARIAQNPQMPVVTYVNTYADVKAESDICCTSSNAVAVVESLKSDTVIFLPDQYLAGNVARQTGKHIIFPTLLETGNQPDNMLDVHMLGWHGKCEVHEKFTVGDIQAVRQQFPDVVVLTHPECSPEVVAASDYSGSTNAMINFVRQSSAPHYLVLTECAMGDNIAAANPAKEILRLCMVRCPHMNTITMENVRDALLYNRYVIDVPEPVRRRAYRAVQRMIEIG